MQYRVTITFPGNRSQVHFATSYEKALEWAKPVPQGNKIVEVIIAELPREDGYYWVQRPSCSSKEIAFYNQNTKFWYVHGYSTTFYDSAFSKIDETRIEPPS